MIHDFLYRPKTSKNLVNTNAAQMSTGVKQVLIISFSSWSRTNAIPIIPNLEKICKINIKIIYSSYK